MASNPDAAKKSFCSRVDFLSHSSYLKSSRGFSDFPPTTSHSFPADNLISYFRENTIFLYFLTLHRRTRSQPFPPF